MISYLQYLTFKIMLLYYTNHMHRRTRDSHLATQACGVLLIFLGENISPEWYPPLCVVLAILAKCSQILGNAWISCIGFSVLDLVPLWMDFANPITQFFTVVAYMFKGCKN